MILPCNLFFSIILDYSLFNQFSQHSEKQTYILNINVRSHLTSLQSICFKANRCFFCYKNNFYLLLSFNHTAINTKQQKNRLTYKKRKVSEGLHDLDEIENNRYMMSSYNKNLITIDVLSYKSDTKCNGFFVDSYLSMYKR